MQRQCGFQILFLFLLVFVSYTESSGARGSDAEATNSSLKISEVSNNTDSPRLYSNEEMEVLLPLLQKEFGKIKSLKSGFVQEKHLSLFSEVVRSKGLFYFQNPDMLRLEFTEPFKSSLVVNGGTVTKFEFLDGKWTKLNSGNKEAILMIIKNITSWLQGQFNNNNLYTVSAREDQVLRLYLTPNDQGFRDYVTGFELGINKKRNGLSYIIIREPGEDYTKISFHDEIINSAIPGNMFDGTGSAPTAPL